VRQYTWFATVVCVIAVIPGFVVGAIFKMVMVVVGDLAEDSDFLYLHALFGFEKPRMIYNWVFAHAIPSFAQAGIAGFCAVMGDEEDSERCELPFGGDHYRWSLYWHRGLPVHPDNGDGGSCDQRFPSVHSPVHRAMDRPRKCSRCIAQSR